MSFNNIKKKQTSDDVNILNADDTEFVTRCESIQNLINSENDDDVLLNHVNSNSYDVKQFNSKKVDLPSSFGLFHANIASLNLHIDDLRLILSRLNYKFDVIGISEHKIKKDSLPFNNTKIPGYNEFIFETTETTHGGTGFYIKDNVDFLIRDDLKIVSPGNFESMFIEIILTGKKNLIVGCVYRHPSSEISIRDFTNIHLEPVLQKLCSNG